MWKREVETAEVRDHGYLRLLQTRAPGETFRGEQNAFKAQVSTLLTLLPPPVLKCRQITVAGKHLTVLKGEQAGCLCSMGTDAFGGLNDWITKIGYLGS